MTNQQSVSPKTRADERQPIDLEHLARYTMGDKDLEAEILGLFLGQVEKSLRELRVAEEPKQWQMAAHALKGTGRAVGAWQVAELSQAAEKLADMTQPRACQDSIEQIAAAADVARAFINERFPVSA